MKNDWCFSRASVSRLYQQGRTGFSFRTRPKKSWPAHILLFIFLVSFQCVDLAGQSSGPDSLQAQDRLVQLLQGNSEQKRTALAEIRNLRTELASRLATAALNDKDAVVRATAAASVVFLPQVEAVKALLPLLGDREAFVRREAAHALGLVGHRDANSHLLRAMTADRDPEVRAAAAIAVGNIGDPASLESLLLLLSRRPKEEDEFLRRSAARSIGQIFEASAKGTTAVLTPQNFLPPKFKDLQAVNGMMPVPAVGNLDKVASTLERVVRSRDEADDTRREAVFALGSMRRPESAGLFTSLLTSPDPYLVEISKEALIKIELEEQRRKTHNQQQ